MSRTYRGFGLGYGAPGSRPAPPKRRPRREPNTRLDERLEEFAAGDAPRRRDRGPARQPASGPCEWCGNRGQRRRVQLADRNTGERAELLLCRDCDTNPSRTVWLRWERAEG